MDIWALKHTPLLSGKNVKECGPKKRLQRASAVPEEYIDWFSVLNLYKAALYAIYGQMRCFSPGQFLPSIVPCDVIPRPRDPKLKDAVMHWRCVGIWHGRFLDSKRCQHPSIIGFVTGWEGWQIYGILMIIQIFQISTMFHLRWHWPKQLRDDQKCHRVWCPLICTTWGSVPAVLA